MREIKFRAWDDNQKIMFDSTCPGIFIHLDGEQNSWDKYYELIGTKKTKQLVLLQYTGLKDKNGVEIYEGDILKRVVTIVVYGTGKPPSDVDDVIDVKWREDYAGFYVGERELFAEVDATYDYATSCRCTKFEVIGNIYENPELLEGGDEE